MLVCSRLLGNEIWHRPSSSPRPPIIHPLTLPDHHTSCLIIASISDRSSLRQLAAISFTALSYPTTIDQTCHDSPTRAYTVGPSTSIASMAWLG